MTGGLQADAAPKVNEWPSSVRAMFLSDLHLGYRLSHASECIAVLERIECEQLYLVGDIVDVARLMRVWYWPQEHQKVLDKICNIHASGIRVRLVPGNHDPCWSHDDRCKVTRGKNLDRIEEIIAPLLAMERQDTWVHETKMGDKLWVQHGHRYDHVHDQWGGVPQWGSRVFDQVSRIFPKLLTRGLRRVFKLMLSRPDRIRSEIINECRAQGYSGVVFGHLHQPELNTVTGLIVANTGDWMEHRSLIVEHKNGSLALVDGHRQVG